MKEAFVPERSQFPLSLELALGTAKNPPPRRIGREGWEAPQGGGCVVGWVAPRRHRRRPRVVVFVVIVVPRVPLFLTQFRFNIYTLPISRNQISHPFVA